MKAVLYKKCDKKTLHTFKKFIAKCDKQRKCHEFQFDYYKVWQKFITKWLQGLQSMTIITKSAATR